MISCSDRLNSKPRKHAANQQKRETGTMSDWIEPALEAFGLSDATAEACGHIGFDGWDTNKYRVSTPSEESWLLSLNEPVKRSTEGTSDRLRSHLQWLQALDGDTDLVVQVPRTSSSGDLLVAVSLPEGERIASVVRWVEGETVWNENDDSQSDYRPETFCQIGNVLARIHNHSETWRRPEDFIRSYAESDDTELTVENMYPALTNEKLSGSDFFQVESVFTAIDDHVRKLERSSSSRGLLHGDFGGTNCLRHGDDFRPIDFDWSSIGWYLYDIGWAFGMAPQLGAAGRQAYLDGYAALRPLPGHALRTIEAFVIESRLRHASWQAACDDFPTAVLHDFLWNECALFLSGAPFLLVEDDTDPI